MECAGVDRRRRYHVRIGIDSTTLLLVEEDVCRYVSGWSLGGRSTSFFRWLRER